MFLWLLSFRCILTASLRNGIKTCQRTYNISLASKSFSFEKCTFTFVENLCNSLGVFTRSIYKFFLTYISLKYAAIRVCFGKSLTHKCVLVSIFLPRATTPFDHTWNRNDKNPQMQQRFLTHFKPFQPSVAFLTETSHFFCFPKPGTFYISNGMSTI